MRPLSARVALALVTLRLSHSTPLRLALVPPPVAFTPTQRVVHKCPLRTTAMFNRSSTMPMLVVLPCAGALIGLPYVGVVSTDVLLRVGAPPLHVSVR